MVKQNIGKMDLIQKLSNQRQQLYKAKWTRRNKAGYQEQVKDLDAQIATLWHEYRCELAEAQHPVSTALRNEKPVWAALVANQDAVAVAEDYLQQTGKSRPVSGHQVNINGRWQTVNDNHLAVAVGRYAMDVPADLPDDVPPLRDILKRRGMTLVWEQRSGYRFGRLVSIST